MNASFLKFNYKLYESGKSFVLLFFIILTLAQIRQNNVTNYNCEICSDKAGYYMYMPAAFYLGFKATNYPDGFDEAHGNGFHIDRTNNKIITKFTCGVAILLLPFYGFGALLAKLLSLNVNPYSYYYLFFINAGMAFYVAAGLWFLKRWLDNYVNAISSFLTVLIIFFGTHLFYYTVDESLMSHAYSFSLFSVMLFNLRDYLKRQKFSTYLVFILCFSLAVLIRPTNILFGIIALLLNTSHLDDVKRSLVMLFNFKNLGYGAFIFSIVFLPQVLYWKFAFGKYIVWSYKEEGFVFWNNPLILAVWFSPQSGLFTYTPIIFLSLIFSVMLIRQNRQSPLIIGTFLVVSYMCAAWINPYFGECNFGKRPMVEYLPVLMMPVAFVLNRYQQFTKPVKIVLILSIIVLVLYNMILFLGFDTCFNGQLWDWRKFLGLFKHGLGL